ncbi:MAG: sugar phosphate isomerase/epimerase [Phycisphaerales bacterium]|nr:sugar phosphate isomerase/epimerase [Phycisphaerales bacterium]
MTANLRGAPVAQRRASGLTVPVRRCLDGIALYGLPRARLPVQLADMMPHLGVCSWSLQPASATDLAGKVQSAGVCFLQLALDPLRRGDWPMEATVAALERGDVEIISGMMAMRAEDYTSLDSIRRTGGVRLDEHWEENLRAARENAALAARLGIPLVTFHAGFLPHDRHDPLRQRMIDRLRRVVEAFAARGIRVGFETGQETAATLLDVLDEIACPTLGVNFDPANMILYGMGDPVSAVQQLAPRVVGIHIKDARPSPTPGTWGEETRFGDGAVDWPSFLDVLRRERVHGDWVIERESGEDRVADVRHAVQCVQSMLQARPVQSAPESRT